MERYQLRKDQDSQAAQNQKAMAALLAQAGDFSLYEGPCTASPRSRSGGWRPIMRPSRNP